MIQFINVSRIYENRAVGVEDVNLTIKPGEFVSLVGRSGAGKSTFIKLLIGEERPTKGRVLFGSYEVNKLRDWLTRITAGGNIGKGREIHVAIERQAMIARPPAHTQAQ